MIPFTLFFEISVSLSAPPVLPDDMIDAQDNLQPQLRSQPILNHKKFPLFVHILQLVSILRSKHAQPV
jgi:hypothetical protein